MTTIAPRESLDKKLGQLLDQVLMLGSMVENATLDAVKALKDRDSEAAKRVYAFDKQINKKRFKIEKSCLALIATQQPMARDLRVLASILEIATELERMGDYAKGISQNLRSDGLSTSSKAHHGSSTYGRISHRNASSCSRHLRGGRCGTS